MQLSCSQQKRLHKNFYSDYIFSDIDAEIAKDIVKQYEDKIDLGILGFESIDNSDDSSLNPNVIGNRIVIDDVYIPKDFHFKF